MMQDQNGPIVRNKQTGALGRVVNGQVVPIESGQSGGEYPGIIQGRPEAPKEPTPKNPYDIQTDQRDYSTDRSDKRFDQTDKLRADFGALDFVKEYPTVARQYAYALDTAPTPSGDQALIIAYAKMLDPGSVVREAEFDVTAAADSAIGRTVSKIKRELGMDGGGRLSDEAREKVRSEMRTLVQKYDQQYQSARDYYSRMAQDFGLNPEWVVGDDYSKTYADSINAYWDSANKPDEKQPGNAAIFGGEAGALEGYGDDGKGNPLVLKDGQALLGYTEEGASQYGPPGENKAIDPRAQALLDELGFRNKLSGDGGATDVAASGMSLGLSDEAAGVGNVIGSALTGDFNVAENYRTGRDVERMRLDSARHDLGGAASLGLEMLGGGAGVLNKAGTVMRAGRAAAARNGGNVTREGMRHQMVREATQDGAVVGGIGGFGYGEGANSGTNALVGAAGGAVLGRLGQKAGNALAARAGRRHDATPLAEAGAAEGVTVNRAMANPNSNNAVTKADASLIGGRRVQHEMEAIEGQLESGVTRLGGDRQPLDRTALGDRVERAGVRTIEATREIVGRKYTQAERMAGDTKVVPARAKAAAQSMIRDLSETANTNSAEIAFLNGLVEDFGKPLSVGALRDLRTTLRKKIQKGDLVFGQKEARVLQIMDEASEDLRQGLAQAGKGAAADALGAADTAYAARMDLIETTVQKLIGKRGQNLTGEQVAKNIESMAKTDAEGLRKLWMQLDPEEKADLRATFANALGRNRKGEFSPAIFLNNIGGNTPQMSARAIRIVFGKDGAESIANLKRLATEVNRVTGAMNSRTSKSGVASYRDWIFSLIGGGGLGAASGGVGTMTAAAAAGVGVKAAADILSARALMSPKIQKWLLSAPKTTSGKAIDAHFNRLGEIAKAEPALAAEIEVLQRGIRSAANDNVGISSAAGDRPENQDEQ